MLDEDTKQYFISRLEEVAYSKVVDESVIFVEEGAGSVCFENICLLQRCFFAVAQIHDGHCWAVMYLWSENGFEIIPIQEAIKKEKYIVRQLIGIYDEFGHKVVVNPSGSWLHHFQKTYRYPVEFYFNVEDYSTNHISQQRIYYLANLSVKSNEKVSFRVDDVEIASVDFIRKFHPTNRLNLSRLIIHDEHVPSGWDNHQVAHTIRILLGLALGRRIVENHWWDNQGQYWFSPATENNRFTSFTEANGDFDMAGFHGGISQDMNAIQFVESVLSVILKKDFEDYSPYINGIEYYILYCSLAKESQQRSILLCALFESIVKTWEAQNEVANKQIEDDNNVERLLSQIKDDVNDRWALFLDRKLNETDEEYKKRQDDFIIGLANSISHINAPIKNKLKKIFEACGWKDIDILAKKGEPSFWRKDYNDMRQELQNIGIRIRAFVDSRNKLFHEHRLYCDDSKIFEHEKKQDLEAKNIQLFVPVLFATILGYKGDYWDSIQNKFMHMPR